MRPATRTLLAESAAILLLASAIGLLWNYPLLKTVFTPESVSPPVAAAAHSSPLPTGLAQVKELYFGKKALFVDARDEAAFREGHIPGSVSLPAGEAGAGTKAFIAAHPLNTTLVVYCNGYGCPDSRETADKLVSAGFGTVFVYEGGLPEWKKAGLPTEGAQK